MQFFKAIPPQTRLVATQEAIETVIPEPSGTTSDQVMRFGLAECDAIVAGVRAAEAAIGRASTFGALLLFDDRERDQYDDRNLYLISAYAELRGALFHFGRIIPAKSLEAAGYSSKQVTRINTLIDTLASGWASRQDDRAVADAIPSPASRYPRGISHENIAR